MKTLLILVLVIALAGGAFLSRPSDADFVTFVKAQTQPAQAQTVSGLGKEILGGLIAKATEQQFVFHDHGLWTTEEQGGQTMYYGAFSHWWKSSAATGATTPARPSAG